MDTSTGIWVRRRDWLRLAWSAPMQDMAGKLGISNVALRKRLVSYGLTIPPQGYWNKVRAGRDVPPPPKVPPRGPGVADPVIVPYEFHVFLPPAGVEAPRSFASKLVPEDLEELRAAELRAIGRGKRVRPAAVLHPAIQGLLDRDAKYRITGGYADHWPAFTTRLSRRHLAILSAVFDTLEKRGYPCQAHVSGSGLHPGVTVGDMRVWFYVKVPGFKFPYGTDLLSSLHAPVDAPLSISVGEAGTWRDDQAGSLETKIAEIAAGAVVAGELAYRTIYTQKEDHIARAAWKRQHAIDTERAVANQRENGRLAALSRARDMLQRAEEMRSIAIEAIAILEAGAVGIDSCQLQQWSWWVDSTLKSSDRMTGTQPSIRHDG